ncbi:oxidoreductase [Streptomyces sp. NPDC008001]|uniref:oxidoreductase n=1 Tax=Streptomyces sp. NPDC008001 TaxID=3364804 RepID=UPI0036E30CAA
MAKWTSARIPDQKGRTAVVTGANSGLGFQTARELARHGAHVVMTARDRSRGTAAVERLLAEQPRASVELRLLDLSDLDSVAAFAQQIVDDGLPVDVLVNNAGVMWPPHRLTPQGYELQFATNHLGHFALTGLLLGRLEKSAAQGRDARVVTVSSVEHRGGTIFFDDLHGERGYAPRAYYSQSKLANALFGLELDRRLRAAGSTVTSVLAHPGYASTNLQSSGPTGFLRFFFSKIANPLMAQPVEKGAWNQLYAATAAGVKGGQFIGPDGFGEYRGHPAVVRPDKAAQDLDVARRLWVVSEQLTQVHYPSH